MGTKAVVGKGGNEWYQRGQTESNVTKPVVAPSPCFTQGMIHLRTHCLSAGTALENTDTSIHTLRHIRNAAGKRVWGGSISRILFHVDCATWWQPCLYSVCYHTLPATYPRTLVGPTFPEHHRISFTRRLATRKPIRPFGASSYLVLLRVMLTLPSMLPWTRWALTPPFHPYPGNPFTAE